MTSGSATSPAELWFRSRETPERTARRSGRQMDGESRSEPSSRYGGPPKLGLVDLQGETLRLEADSGPEFSAPTGWTRDGARIFFESRVTGLGAAAMGRDVSVLDLASGRRQVWLQTGDNEHSAVPSPDGGLVAYVSDESGQPEVYLRAAGGGGAHVPVSSAGGTEPRWTRSGRGAVLPGGRSHHVRVGLGRAPDVEISPLRVAYRLPASLATDAGSTSAGWDLRRWQEHHCNRGRGAGRGDDAARGPEPVR